jgi:hypothetical protein
MTDAPHDKLADLGLLSEAYWSPESSDTVKSLLLFFDGIALLTPDYMVDRPFQADPVLAEPLADKGLLHILSPEKLVSESIANDLAGLFEGLLQGKAFDALGDEPFAEISQSRLGLDVSPDLMEPLMVRLEQHGLAKPSQDGVSRPVNRAIRAMVLGTLSQLLRGPGEQLGYALQPVAAAGRGYGSTVPGFLRLLDREPMPTAGHVVVSDLQQVSFDLSTIPLDEVLDFREQHGEAYRAYARDLRAFVRSVSTADPVARDEAFADRREALSDAAADLNRHMRTAWRRPMASFGLGIGGAAVTLVSGNPIPAGIGFASALLGFKRQADPSSAYTYLFRAAHTWPPTASS